MKDIPTITERYSNNSGHDIFSPIRTILSNGEAIQKFLLQRLPETIGVDY